MNNFFRLVVNVGLAIFLLWSGLLVIFYFGMLFEKIVHPNFKNMNGKEAFQLGLLAILFLVLDILIIRRFVRLRKKSK